MAISRIITDSITDGSIVDANLSSSGLNVSKFTTGTLGINQVPSGAVLQVQQSSTDALTSTTSQAGFVALTVYITPYFASSKILIMASLYGSGDDDATAWMEYNIGGGGWIRDTTLNGAQQGGTAFCDFSITRAVAEKTIQVGGSTHLMVSFNTTQQIGIRVICSAENTGGFWLNSGSAAPAGYNNTSSKSTLMVWEVKG